MEQQSNELDGGEDHTRSTPEEDLGTEPRIYVASLSDYNAGRLHGTWLSVSNGIEELAAGIDSMLAASPESGAEEWAIHDYEGFGPLRLSEYESLNVVTAIANGIGEYGAAFAHWAGIVGTEYVEETNRFEDAYRGHWEDVTSYASELLDDLGINRDLEKAVPEYLQPYVKLDVESFARDLELGGDIVTSNGDGGVYVFDGRT